MENQVQYETRSPDRQQALMFGEFALYAAELAGIDDLKIKEPVEIGVLGGVLDCRRALSYLISQPGMRVEAAHQKDIAADIGISSISKWGIAKSRLKSSGLIDIYKKDSSSDARLVSIQALPDQIIENADGKIVSAEILNLLRPNVEDPEKLDKIDEKQRQLAGREPIDYRREALINYLIGQPGFAVKGHDPTMLLRKEVFCTNDEFKPVIRSLKKQGIVEGSRDPENYAEYILRLNIRELLENSKEKFVTLPLLEKLSKGLKMGLHQQEILPTEVKPFSDHEFMVRPEKSKGRANGPTLRFMIDVPDSRMFYKNIQESTFADLAIGEKLLITIGHFQGVKINTPLEDYIYKILNRGLGKNPEKEITREEVSEVIAWAKENGFVEEVSGDLKITKATSEIFQNISDTVRGSSRA